MIMDEFSDKLNKKKSEELLKLIDDMYYDIFRGNNIIDPYKERNIIFDYLVKNIKIDWDLHKKIVDGTAKRNTFVEMKNLLKYKIGTAKTISMLYKLLLEKAFIYSICYICDDATDTLHQLNLVYMGDAYSFDDIVSVIAGVGSKEKYFNYDLNGARLNNQGLKDLDVNTYFLGLSSVYVYTDLYLNKDGINYPYIRDKKFVEEKINNQLLPLPDNIQKYIPPKPTNVIPFKG